MKIQDLTIFQDAEALSQVLRREKISKERFWIEAPVEAIANGLYAAVKASVERRGRRFVSDEATLSHIKKAAEWLTNPNGTPGLLLCGLYGNGKTTLSEALAWLISHLTEKTEGYSGRKKIRAYTAKEITRVCSVAEKFKEQYDEYHQIPREEMLIIDDLGEEPAEVFVFGMGHTPIVDILLHRYANSMFTIVTSNLETKQIREKYGERIYDRFREFMTPIIFTNDSYRKLKQ